MTRADRFSRELSHLRFVECYLSRAGLYAAAQRMQDARKAHQERWAREVFRGLAGSVA